MGKIPLGIDFRKHIQREIMRSDVVLAIVGQKWLDELNKRIEEKKDDHLSIEIEQSLLNDKLIIPVLIDNAHMPSAEELPETIRDFHYKEAIKINRTPHFDNDIQRLLEGISISIEYLQEITTPNTDIKLLETYEAWQNLTIESIDEYAHSFDSGVFYGIGYRMSNVSITHVDNKRNIIFASTSDIDTFHYFENDIRSQWIEREISKTLNREMSIDLRYIEPKQDAHKDNSQDLDDIPF